MVTVSLMNDNLITLSSKTDRGFSSSSGKIRVGLLMVIVSRGRTCCLVGLGLETAGEGALVWGNSSHCNTVGAPLSLRFLSPSPDISSVTFHYNASFGF